jgi:hypothetical protein
MSIKILVFTFWVLLLFNIVFAQEKIGCVSGNCNNGKGTYIFSNGSIYVGDFVNNNMEGFGKLTDAYGNCYTGYFKNNKYNGVGKFVRTDGTKYIGEFKDGKRNGLGTQWFSETYKEKGRWENDRFIEEVDFQDFVVEEPYSFCNTLFEILQSAIQNYGDIKGEQISKLIPDEYYATKFLKELTTVSIHTKDGYKGYYYKGTKDEANKKFEELKNIIKDCFNQSCYSAQLQLNNGINEKFYDFLILSAYSFCKNELVGLHIKVCLSISNNAGDVYLLIPPK